MCTLIFNDFCVILKSFNFWDLGIFIKNIQEKFNLTYAFLLVCLFVCGRKRDGVCMGVCVCCQVLTPFFMTFTLTLWHSAKSINRE